MKESFIENLNSLNEAQRLPTLHKDGALIIIAGAGSGKTRVLTYRIAYLMTQGVDSFSILALTFTNKAAREMKERISTLVGSNESKNLWMGTFHSVFARILRSESDKLGYPSNFTIYDAQDSERLIRSIIKEKGYDKELYKSKQIKNRISAFKNNLITVKTYFNDLDLQESDKISQRPKMGDLYREYVDRCFKAGAMDFDDLLLRTNELLNRFPSVLAKYQDRFKYILVDEYQDTNHSQYLIVKILSDKFQNICVVGDDAQSIYAFRGANINNILNFQKDYQDTTVYKLEQNYRSTKTIVSAANSIIKHNITKLEKNVWTNNSDGEKIIIQRLPTDSDEGRYVASSIFEIKMNMQKNNSDFAILYRTNAQSRALEDALRNRDIQYRVYGGVSFYQRKEIKDILAYLRVIVNTKDEESLKRIINYPPRGIGQTTIDKLVVSANENNLSIFETIQRAMELKVPISSSIIIKLQEFVSLIKGFIIFNEISNAFEISNEVAKKTKILIDLKSDGTPEGISKSENIEELLNGVKDFVEGQRDLADFNGTLSEFLIDVALATDFDNNKNNNQDTVSLMTIHLAKGLEFPLVYIVGMEEDLFPSPMNIDTRGGLEEERRLFYVALTRAKEQAFLTYSESRYRWGKLNSCEPSRFISEIDEQYIINSTPKDSYRSKPIINTSIFDRIPIIKKRTLSNDNLINNPSSTKLLKLRHINSLNNVTDNSNELLKKFKKGDLVEHQRFGKGKVVIIEGIGNDKKASIDFYGIGVKKLLLNFAKLKIISNA